MTVRALGITLLLSFASTLHAQREAEKATPLPRLDTVAPTGSITAIAFSPDGKTLYAAGFDKLVRVWKFDAAKKTFTPAPEAFLRLPIGPGRIGMINLLGVSPDGKKIAVTGLGDFRGSSSFGEVGQMVSAELLTVDQRRDRFQIWILDTATGAVAILRGHEDEVLALAFASANRLVSASRRTATKDAEGQVVVWDPTKASVPNEKGELIEQGARLISWNVKGVPLEGVPGLDVKPGATEFRVALAWGDGILRVTEIPMNGNPVTYEPLEQAQEHGRASFTRSAAFLPADRMLTGGWSQSGYVQLWEAPFGRTPVIKSRQTLTPPEGRAWALPRAVSLMASKEGGKLDHAAVVARVAPPANAKDRKPGDDYLLYLLPLPEDGAFADKASRAVPYDIGFWERPPAMGASPDGRYFAVAHESNDRLRIYDAQGLLETGKRIAEFAVSDPVRSVAFLTKGADLGLLLSREKKTGPGEAVAVQITDQVLDFASRGLSANPAANGWKPAVAAGWTIASPARGSFTWSAPGAPAAKVIIALEAREQVTDFTILPRSQQLPVPILAVATWNARVSEPVLTLYALRDGRAIPVRVCQGHTEPIRSLAASPDGRLLASVGDDKLVCLWSVTDLALTVGKRASVPGLMLEQAKQGADVVVKEIKTTSPAAEVLKQGDVIKAFLRGEAEDKERPVRSPTDFLAALWAERPDVATTLSIVRDGQPARVRITPTQAKDDKKPLATLYVPDRTGADWLAWTPTGPYDSSGEGAERSFGWQFNPGPPGQAGPARFAPLSEYRKELLKEGLLPLLVKHGNLPDALRALPQPEPTMKVELSEDGLTWEEPDADRERRVRSRALRLRITIDGVPLDTARIRSLTWRIGDGAEQSVDMKEAAGATLLQNIELPGRGQHLVRIALETRESGGRESFRIGRDLLLRYQPPRPSIAMTTPARIQRDEDTDNADYVVEGKVEAAPGEDAKANLVVAGKLVKELTAHFKETVKLVPGTNDIRIVAVNKGAAQGGETDESAEVALSPRFDWKSAPRIAIASIEPVGARGDVQTWTPGKLLTVASARVRIRGTIRAEKEKLTEAKLGDAALRGFKVDDAAEFAIDEVVDLEPGAPGRELRFTARTPNSKVGEVRATVAYLPPLPEVRIIRPAEGSSVVDDAADLRVLLNPADQNPFKVGVRVTNKDKAVLQDGAATIEIPSEKLAEDEAGIITLTRKLKLDSGENRIAIVVSNRWQTAPTLERGVTLLRPPVVAELLPAAPIVRESATDLTAVVHTSSELTRFVVAVGPAESREFALDQLKKEKKSEKDGIGTWHIAIPKVRVAEGDNELRLFVSNRDGPCVKPGVAKVAYRPIEKLPPPPDVHLLNVPNGPVEEPVFALRYHVISPGIAVDRVELRRGDEVVDVQEGPGDNTQRGSFELAGQFKPMDLTAGTNEFRVVAVNRSHSTPVNLSVTLTPKPEQMELELPALDEIAGPIYTLRGYVTWTDAASVARVRKALECMSIIVNDMKTEAAARPAEAPDKRRTEFTAQVVLDRRINRIRLDCPGLRRAVGNREVTVNCKAPREMPRMLHVVAIAPGLEGPNANAFLRRITKSLQLDPPPAEGPQELRSAAFTRGVRMYPFHPRRPERVLTGNASAENIRNAVKSIVPFAKAEDVVLIYWTGAEREQRGVRWLLVDPLLPNQEPSEKTAILVNELLRTLAKDMKGASALLLDVSPQPGNADSPVPKLGSSGAAVLRLAQPQASLPSFNVLAALEQEATTMRPAVSLADLAARLGQKGASFAAVDHNLDELRGVATLDIIRKR